MASAGSTQALIQRRQDDLARMPPPPVRRLKRPAEVLDEDDYTGALSDIIAREFFPGLREAKAQEEYLEALESGNQTWIREAGQKLKDAVGPQAVQKAKRATRDTRFDTPRSYRNAADTPRGFTGSETPATAMDGEHGETDEENKESKKADISNMSLSAFQARYTSEDNESFNNVLDKQNAKRRKKHSYLWTPDQRILSQRQLTHRATQDKLIKEKAEYEETNGKQLVPFASGATTDRPAKPDNWKQRQPNNSLMFNPDSIDESGLPTIMHAKEAASNTGPKQIVHANTRFPPLYNYEDPDPAEPEPSIHTSMIARRLRSSGSVVETESGGETPRVNGYAFVDEDEPDAVLPPSKSEPTYRDLLAGQVGDSIPNPFHINTNRKREDLHYRMVERDAAKKRTKEKETVKGVGENTPTGNMTPAARKLMEKLGKTPLRQPASKEKESEKEMWTPAATPRRKMTK